MPRYYFTLFGNYFSPDEKLDAILELLKKNFFK